MTVILLIVIAAVVATLLIVAASKPGTFQLERSAVIAAPPETVFAHIEDFHKWRAWSPWEKLDPDMKRTHEGAEAGLGAVYSWQGGGKAGTGRMEIIEAKPAQAVVIRLDFIKPFKATNTAEFVLTPKDDTTLVTWAMHGPQPFIAKIMGTVFNMDDLVGKDFEAGLAALKTLCEAPKLEDQSEAAQTEAAS